MDGVTNESCGIWAYNADGHTYSIGISNEAIIFGKDGNTSQSLYFSDVYGFTSTTCSVLTQQGTVAHNSIIKQGKVVTASARIFGGQWTASGSFFQVPYKPHSTAYGFAYMIIDGVERPLICSVDSNNGYVSLAYSTSKTATQIGFSITYTV